MAKLTINYVSADPGVGKTRAAINLMHAFLRKAWAGEVHGVIMYVAPTIDLLEQTRGGLLEQLVLHNDQHLSDYCPAPFIGSAHGGRVVASKVAAHYGRRKSSVIFVTHPGFLRLRTHPRFKDTTVIFDESRHWVLPVKGINFGAETRPLFDILFDIEPVIQGVCRVFPRDISTRQARESISSVGDARGFKHLIDLHRLLSANEEGNSRVKGYGALRHNQDATYSMVRVEIPSAPFAGFKQVFILASRFESSQMYYLLRRDQNEGADFELVDRTSQFLNRWSKGYGSALKRVHSRQSNLVLVPLLSNSNLLSITQLNTGFIGGPELPPIPRSKLKASLVRLRDREKSSRILGRVEPLARDYGITTDIVSWMVESSMSILKRWRAFQECDELPLIFTNHGDPERRFKALGLKKKLEWVNHAEARGVNIYSECDVVMFLTSIIPDPVIRKVLAHSTHGIRNSQGHTYDPDQDYVVDVAIQCLGRGVVRDHYSTKKQLVIVPTLSLAEYIKRSLGGRPVINTQFLQSGGYRLHSMVELNGGSNSLNPHGRSEKDSRLLSNLYTKKSKAKRAGDFAKVAAVELEIAALHARTLEGANDNDS